MGGLAVFLGIVFFVAIAVARGWIDEPTRVVLAFLGSGALVGLGLGVGGFLALSAPCLRSSGSPSCFVSADRPSS